MTWSKWCVILALLLTAGCSNPIAEQAKSPVASPAPSVTSINGKELSLESLDEAVAVILSAEPLDGMNKNRYVVQADRSVIGSGTRKVIVKESNMLSCWVFNSGVLPKTCTALQMGLDYSKDIDSQQPFRYSYVTYAIGNDSINPDKARILVYESFQYGPSATYWELVVERIGSRWQKQSLIKHPMPFPSTW
jgi:hypothetical protein